METVILELTEYGNRITITAPGATALASDDLRTMVMLINSFVSRLGSDDAFANDMLTCIKNNPYKPTYKPIKKEADNG